jgi:membrane protease YdiL (CAAX protease family)
VSVSAATHRPAADRFPPGLDLRLVDLLVTVLITLGGVALIFGALLLAARVERPLMRANAEVALLLLLASIYLVFAGGIVVGLRRVRQPVRMLGLHWPTPPMAVLIVAGLVPWFTAEGILAWTVGLIANRGRPLPSNTRELFIQRPHGVGVLILALLVTAVLAPVCEEIFFRGMLYRYLRAHWPVWAAVVGSASLFGLAHFSGLDRLTLWPVFTFMGIVLALLYEWTGSLGNTILLHSLNNAILTVLAFSALSS